MTMDTALLGGLGGLFWNSSYLSVFWLWCLTRGPPAALSALSFPENSTQRAGRALLLASFLFAHQSLWTLYPSLICMPPPGHGSLAQLPQTHCPGSWEEPVCPRILDYLKQPVGPEPTWLRFLPSCRHHSKSTSLGSPASSPPDWCGGSHLLPLRAPWSTVGPPPWNCN